MGYLVIFIIDFILLPCTSICIRPDKPRTTLRGSANASSLSCTYQRSPNPGSGHLKSKVRHKGQGGPPKAPSGLGLEFTETSWWNLLSRTTPRVQPLPPPPFSPIHLRHSPSTTMASFAPGFRRLFLKASAPSRFFVCNQCLRQAAPRGGMPSRILNVVRSRSYADASILKPMGTTLADSISTRAAPTLSETAKAAKKAWPETNSRGVGFWLLGSAASVFGIVVFGGLTRLTESG